MAEHIEAALYSQYYRRDGAVPTHTQAASILRYYQKKSPFFRQGPSVKSAARSPIPNRPQQDSPLLKLPAELRALIYGLLLRDLLDGILDRAKHLTDPWSDPTKKPPTLLPFNGAFALVHASHTLRNECVRYMSIDAPAEIEKRDDGKDTPDRSGSVDERPGLQLLSEPGMVFKLIRDMAAVGRQEFLKILLGFVYGQACLRDRSASDPLWSKLELDEKRVLVFHWYCVMPFSQRISLDRFTGGSEDKWDVLVRVVDSGEERDSEVCESEK